MISSFGLKIIPVFSFHQCGGNVGDSCNFPLPSFITSSPVQPFWVDFEGHIDQEYISIGYDDIKIDGRTPIEMYSEFMKAFQSIFREFFSKKIFSKIEIGLGPCGELRYPSYQLAYWSYPGCGEFQSYDEQMVNKLAQDAQNDGKPEFGHNPTDIGGYNSSPQNAEFWTTTWKTDYGQWFIRWYSKQLLNHAVNVLAQAREIFSRELLSSKIAGIHWWYLDDSHCAETTAGLNNFLLHDGYRDILTVFQKYKIDVCFTCLEMGKNPDSGSDAPDLVQQVLSDTKWAGLQFEGENALPVYQEEEYDRIVEWSKQGLVTFTYLRLCDDLMNEYNFKIFCDFVLSIKNLA